MRRNMEIGLSEGERQKTGAVLVWIGSDAGALLPRIRENRSTSCRSYWNEKQQTRRKNRTESKFSVT
jgi:hypothetical protein